MFLVEKPMALHSEDAEEILELADKKGRILMVGHLLIYHPVVDRLKEMVLSGNWETFTTSTLSESTLGSSVRMRMPSSLLLLTTYRSSFISSKSRR